MLLTVLSAVVLPLLLFAAVTWQVTADGPLAEEDERLARRMREDAPPAALAEFLADLGNIEVALPVLAAALAYVWTRGRRRRPPPAVLAAAAAMAAVPALVAPLKALTGRPGPLGGTGYFPSGHAATAVVAYGAAALLLASVRARPRWARSVRWALPAAAALLCAAVGAGLVWRGYHWPLDVLGSWCLGVPLLAAVLAASGGSGRSGRPGQGRPDPPGGC
ncbi:phosphatase PAP2 family protein [Streptomyces fenghuangensis]|uniref:phosphatase PAP2 family protein n=1 Tax=Streptomyces sp. ICN903 TaxID=2964654 RepID=UPI001EDB9A90|nr:phosphatase PAP2 family protein [Streptomyces sp. ICN903]MCG3039261.1 phosphatase PAP2 family protein [Streptomyces sp. ICN903]